DEMITTEIGVTAFGLSPRNAHGGYHGSLKKLVLMGEQHAAAQPIHSAAIRRILAEIEFGIHNRALPLADVPFAMRLKWLGQRLQQLRRCARIAATTRYGDGEFTAARGIDFAGQRDVALFGFAELPVHFEIAG